MSDSSKRVVRRARIIRGLGSSGVDAWEDAHGEICVNKNKIPQLIINSDDTSDIADKTSPIASAPPTHAPSQPDCDSCSIEFDGSALMAEDASVDYEDAKRLHARVPSGRQKHSAAFYDANAGLIEHRRPTKAKSYFVGLSAGYLLGGRRVTIRTLL